MRVTISIGIAICLLLSSIMVITPSTKADTPVFYISYPSALEHYPHQVGRGPFNIYNRDGAQVSNDNDAALFIDDEPSVARLFVGNYNSTEMHPMDGGLGLQTALIPDDGYVWLVFVVASFVEPMHPDTCPNYSYAYSIDDMASWTGTSVISAGSTGSIMWNITAEEDWTPAMLKSANTWVRLTIFLDGHYDDYWSVDYIGFLYYWSYVPIDWEQPPENETFNETQIDFHWFGWDAITGGNLLGLLGFCGLIGFIAGPAIMVHSLKRGAIEYKFKAFIGALAFTIVSFFLFMTGIGGWG